MNSVDYIRKICKERKIPISKLEKDCGFSNGYIASLKKGKFPSDRLYVISEYLEIPVDRIMYPDKNGAGERRYYDDETAEMAQSIFESKELKLLFDAAQNASPSDIKLAYNILLELKKREIGNG